MAVWCPYLISLQPHGGYAPIAANHAQYVVGLAGWVDDMFSHGYYDNAELQSIVPYPPGACEGMKQSGRLTGFGVAYEPPDGGMHNVLFAVHLFADDAAAAAWSEGFLASFVPHAGQPDGPSAFSMDSPPGLPDQAIVAEHVGEDGVRTWGSVPRGPIVGWVIDFHEQGQPAIDVPAALALLADRIEAISALATGEERPGADAAHMLSAPLALTAYGARGAGLTWDWGFGGCADAVERGLVAGEQARVDAERFGRVSGCTGMYSPDVPAAADGTVRVFSSVSMYASGEGASESMSALAAESDALGGLPFDPPILGDEGVGRFIAAVDAGDLTYASTRIAFRRGAYVASLGLHSTAPGDASAEVAEWARELDARMTEYLAP